MVRYLSLTQLLSLLATGSQRNDRCPDGQSVILLGASRSANLRTIPTPSHTFLIVVRVE
jgi:hypothetical protein